MELLEAAKALLSNVQGCVGEKTVYEDLDSEALANREGGVCQDCRHRPICKVYWRDLVASNLLTHGETRFPTTDIVGRLEVLEELSVGQWSLRIRLEDRKAWVRGVLSLPEGLSLVGQEDLPISDTVGIFGVIPRRPLESMSETMHFVTSRPARVFAQRASC